MDLVQATNTPELLPLGGKEYPVRALKFKEWATLQAWLLKHVPGPIARVAAAIQQLRDSGQPVDLLTEEVMLDHAHREAMSWPPRVGSSKWIAAIDAADGGLAEVLFAALSATVPGFTREQAQALAEAGATAEIRDVVDMATYGIRPAKKADAGPLPTPPGAASSAG